MNIINKFIKYYIARPIRAYRLLSALIKHKHQNEAFLITSYQIGDMIYAFAYANALNQRLKSEGKRLILYLAENRKSFLNLYDFDFEVRLWDNTDARMMKSVQDLNFSHRHVICGLKHDIYSAIAPCILKDQKSNNKDCLEIIRNSMYFVPEAEIQYPKFDSTHVTAIANFETVKDKVAIINPYSNALKGRFEIFDIISEYLVSKGYIVYSNVIKDQVPTKGSIPLDCSIFEFYNICNQVPLVVSIRSGIIDLAVSANTKFFVVYPERRLHDGFFNIYTLKAWQTKNVIVEAIHVNNETTMNQFVNFVNLNNL